MTIKYALVGIDGEVFGIADTRHEVEVYIGKELKGFYFDEDIVEFDYNDSPMTDRGRIIEDQIKVLLKDVRKLHINKQIGFYELHIDDRLQMILDMLLETQEAETFSFGDSRWKDKTPEELSLDTDVPIQYIDNYKE